MIEEIRKCRKCRLCFNQKPLLDTERACQIFWVGLSAKKIETDVEIPLAPSTNTGRIICKIEEVCKGVTTYKTNLVKCLPLTKQQKLRYPSTKEMDCCFENLQNEIKVLNPKIVFLLGEKVSSSVGKNLNIKFEKWEEFDFHYKTINQTYYVPIQHPSYIYIYKRKKIDAYISSVEKMISLLLQQ